MNKEIIIVSGLPRSGTSMMMQMIRAGGIEVLTDDLRKADISNPEGYFEYEPVKKLATGNSWMGDARGKCVKIIAQLIPFISKDENYKIIFMNRTLNEVLRSQQVMLGKDPNAVNPVLSDVFTKQVQKVYDFMNTQSNIQWMEVSYQNVISDPEGVARDVAGFLGVNMSIEKMAEAVKPDLYRNKA